MIIFTTKIILTLSEPHVETVGEGDPSQINIYSPITKYDSISLHDFHFPYWPMHPLDAVIDTNWGRG